MGDTSNTSSWTFTNNHIGTHIDTPNHFSNDGSKSWELDTNFFVFEKVYLIDIPCDRGILIGKDEMLKQGNIPAETEILLIRTGFEKFRSADKYWDDNPGIAAELADYFRSKVPSLRCLGFDFISLTSWNFRPEGSISHMEFLSPSENKKPILIIEDMSLDSISSPIKKLIAAPIFMSDGNGGPITILAEV